MPKRFHKFLSVVAFAAVTFVAALPDFMRIAAGQVNAVKAMMEGRLRIEGNLEFAAALREMAAWLELRGPDEGPLFCPVDKAWRITIRRLTTQAIYALVARRARKAEVSHLSPHDGRRTFASDLFDAGVDAVQVQGLMGHASLLTTGGYDRRPELARLAAVERLHFPYPTS